MRPFARSSGSKSVHAHSPPWDQLSRETLMTKVPLVNTQKPFKGEEWTLAATEEGLVLADVQGKEVTFVPNDQAPLRIQFPSFWASVTYLTVLDEGGGMHLFEPKKETLAQVRALVLHCQAQAGPAAVAAVQHTAVRDLVIGAAPFVLGTVLTVGSVS